MATAQGRAVGTGHAAAAWLLLQVLSLLSGTYGWPGGVMRIAVGTSLVGFAVVFVVAWFHGERGAQKVSGTEVALLGAVIGIGTALLWVTEAHRPADVGREPAATAATAEVAERGNAIAVLPFRNLSTGKDDEYFADGIAEELLDRLTNLPQLKVAGRTSSFAFKGRDVDTRRIAEQLGVAYLLEGSVRRAGERVRVTVQLVRADTGLNVWSETYDRALTDIFAVQDEISTAIAAALQLSLQGPAAGVPQAPRIPLDAYDAYLRGRALMATRSVVDLEASRTEFAKVLAIVPDYAPALTSLARVNLLIPMWSQTSGERTHALVAEAEQLARRALDAGTDNANAHAVLGTIRGSYQWRWTEAEAEFDRAIALAPGNADILNFAGDLYRSLLDRQRAYAAEGRAADLDPLGVYNQDDLAYLDMAFGRYEDAISHARNTLAIDPSLYDPYLVMAWSYGELRQLGAMRETVADARGRSQAEEPQLLLLDAWLATAEGRREDAVRLLDELSRQAERAGYSSALLGYAYLRLGESDRAARWLERAYDTRDPQLVYQEPVRLEEIARNPVTAPLLERDGLRQLIEIRRRNGTFH